MLPAVYCSSSLRFQIIILEHRHSNQHRQKLIRYDVCIFGIKCLSTTLERSFDFAVFLVQSLASLLGKRVLVSVGSVVSGQNVDGSVQSRERRLSGNLGESTVVGDEVNHFLLHVLSVFFHAVGSLSKRRGHVHVLTDLSGVYLVLERDSPVFGEGVRGDLVRDLDDSGGNLR